MNRQMDKREQRTAINPRADRNVSYDKGDICDQLAA